ncbi:MAG: primosomal protein N' [Gammaproteobacteria bacterium]|nr:primosomal protein N' [Gammaproteobacteria bacterium]
MKNRILQIAVPCPLYTCFDYLAPDGANAKQLQTGMRVRVPFGPRQRIGLVLGLADSTTIPQEKLKQVLEVLDTTPLLSRDDLKLLEWAGNYYHHPIGDAISTALPVLLNKGNAAAMPDLPGWKITPAGQKAEDNKKAPRQNEILALLRQHPEGLSNTKILAECPNTHSSLRALDKKGWISAQSLARTQAGESPLQSPLALNAAQTEAVDQIGASLQQFQVWLLDGVTGSGKTEVYLQIIQRVLEAKRQALVLVPEINLTPQMLARFRQRFNAPLAVFHSRLTDRERLSAWLMARDGSAPIVIGTRSAVWTPLARPGIFIVDEEHDSSYKQDAGFRYSARDISVMRGRQAQAPVLLGSATPALESLYNAGNGRYRHLRLPERAGGAVPPSFHLIDMRGQYAPDGLSPLLLAAVRQHLAKRQQALIFINRRGYAPSLMCHSCGWVADCRHCDAHLTFHDTNRRLQCHHCGTQYSAPTQCPNCKAATLRLLGVGTERVEQGLRACFPDARILRIDSDSTRRKKSMETLLQRIHSGEADILVGTQMLAKGHHFPKVTLAGIINVDSGLFGVDFRASERMAQLFVQVAGRAGRAQEPGQVFIQTYHPEHPLLTRLLREGYAAFAYAALEERRQAGLPPYSRLALLRAEAPEEKRMMQFLNLAKQQAESLPQDAVQFQGPVPAPMERRATQYRGQLLLLAYQRAPLHELLRHWLPRLNLLPDAKKIRWSLDVDPQDLF